METLYTMKVHEKAKIKKIQITDQAQYFRLLEMGFLLDTLVQVKFIASRRKNMILSIRDYQICLSQGILSQIEVEKL